MYEFQGHVTGIDQFHCNFQMRDVTDPTNPAEEWRVQLAKLPSPPIIGQYWKFIVTTDGRGVFEVMPTKTWTAADLLLARKRARMWLKLFRVSAPPPDPKVKER